MHIQKVADKMGENRGAGHAGFAAIDIAARPEIEFRCGEEGKFIDRSGNSHAAEKGNSYP